jgi:hypothetical protein
MRLFNLWTSGSDAWISVVPVLREVFLPSFVCWLDDLIACSNSAVHLCRYKEAPQAGAFLCLVPFW